MRDSDDHRLQPPNLSQLTGTVFVAGQLPVTRLAGADRVRTAVAVSKDRFPKAGSADAVVLASSMLYPDALAGAPLASAKHAPLLLTGAKALDKATLSEIERVLPAGGKVYLLGGEAALSPAVQASLTDAGFTTKRLGGSDRYATAVKIAHALGNPSTVVEVSGTGFADGLSAGPAASKLGAAILLTNGRHLARATADYLAAHASGKRFAVGGQAAKADPGAKALVGADRYATSAKVASRFFAGATAVNLATGQAFPDALAGGPYAGAPMLLVPGTSTKLASSSSGYLGTVASTVTGLRALGGADVLRDAVVEAAQQLVR